MKKTLFLVLCIAIVFSVHSQNNCLRFNNSSSNTAVYNNTAALNPSDVITVEAWINASSWRGAIHEGSILGKDGWSSGDAGYMLRSGEGGDLCFVISIGGSWVEARTSSNPLSTGTWYHVAGVYDGANVKIYIDGVEAASTSTSGSISQSSSYNLNIGNCHDDSNRYFDGDIDEVRVWHAALGQATVDAWKDKTITSCHPEYANMIVYYELDDNTAPGALFETISSSNTNSAVSGASYIVSTNGSFVGSAPCQCTPSALIATSITSTSADLDWTENGTAVQWDIEWGTVGFSPTGTPTIDNTTSKPYSLSGLSANTSYDFYVRADCGGSTSGWVGPYNFATSCGTISSFPYTETFTIWPPLCWNLTGGTQTNVQYGGNCAEGSFWAWADGNEAWMASAPIDISSLSSPILDFDWSHQYDAGYPNDQLIVQVTDNGGSTWISVFDFAGLALESSDGATSTTPGSFVNSGNIDLSSFGNTIQIRYIFHSGYGPDCFVDNVSVSEIVACLDPSSLTAGSITSISAELGWTENGAATQWDIEWGPSGFSPTGTPSVDNTISNPYNLTGLTSSTSYDFYVRSDCSGTTSAWVGPFNFTSLSCIDPSASTASGITSISANLAWTENGSATQWDIEWGLSGFSPTGTPSVDNTASNPYNLTGLSSNTSYGFYVRSDCGANSSAWYGPFNFTTLACVDPSALTVTGITATTADLGWIENGSATQWDIEWGLSGFTPTGTPSVDNTAFNPHTLTGLFVSRDYDYYVRADCGGNTSAWVGPFAFTTTYCASGASSLGDEDISNVTFGTINNTSVCASLTGTQGTATGTADLYSDFSATVAAPSISQGATIPISVTITECSSSAYSHQVNVYIDFNNNGVLNDAGEEFVIWAYASSNTHTINSNIAVPVGASVGTTRMRVVCQETNVSGPCTVTSWGETEDYTIDIVPCVDMSVDSCTISQQNTTDVPRGLENREVICFQIVTNDPCNPLELTSFEIQSDGTSDYSTDITNAKIWYTGTSNSLIASSQFGSTYATPLAPGNPMTITGSQILSEGTNYFWLTYDLPAGATIDNYIDAICNSITIDGVVETPDVQNPLGNRKIIELLPCTHSLKLYDFNKATSPTTSWGTDVLDVFVDGSPVITNATLGSGDANGLTYTFTAGEGQIITTVYTGSSSDARYVITGGQGDYIMEDGVENTVPVGVAADASCYYYPKFTINGDGYFNGETIGAKSNSSGDLITLTDEIQGQYATAWHNTKVNLSTDFSITFELNFGDRTGAGFTGGGDGIAFVFQDKCISTGGSGSGIGFGGITPSIGIEFDTYNNDATSSNDATTYHTSIFKDGNNTHGSGDELVTPYVFGTLCDGAYKEYTVSWEAATTTMKVFEGTVEVLSYSGDIENNIFAGNPDVYWGFTAATGESTNHHRVKVLSYPSIGSSSALADVTISSGSSIQSAAAQGGATYLWSPDDGSIDDPTVYNPTFNPTVTTSYTVTITDDCSNIQTDNFTITIGILPVELVNFNANCNKDNIQVYWQTASELNNDYFEVEKSTDGTSWYSIGNVKGQGNSSTMIDYSFIDKAIVYETTYYRLKQVDFDGSISYSEIVYVDCVVPIEIILYPNPAKDILHFNVYNGDSENVSIKITDLLGRIAYSNNYKIGGDLNVDSIPLENINDGLYIVIVIDNESKEVLHTQKIVIKK